MEKEKYPVKFAHNLSPFYPCCGSGEYMTNEDGNKNNFCGQCGTALDWDHMENIDTEEIIDRDNMNLTREQAILEHRKMWNWIADETVNRKEKVYKKEYFQSKNIICTPESCCYLCEFSRQNINSCGCNCIIDLGDEFGCVDSYYLEWSFCVKKDWEESARLDRIIANLPERKENAG